MIRFILLTTILVSSFAGAIWSAGLLWASITSAPKSPAATLSEQWAPAGDRGPTKLELDLPSLSAYPQTAARPLFFEGRRYPVKATPQAAPPPAIAQAPPPTKLLLSADKLSLRGVMVGRGVPRALIETPQPNNSAPLLQWYEIGEALGEWTITRITPDEVEIRAGGQSATLILHNFTAKR